MARVRTVIAALALGALGGVPLTAPAVADSEPGEIVHRQSILTPVSATGDIGRSRVVTQVANGAADVLVLPGQPTRGLRNLDGFSAFGVDGEAVTVSGRGLHRFVAEADLDSPITFEIRYALDGKGIRPRDLVGRSGVLEVTYVVTNTTVEPREVTFKDATGVHQTETVDVAVPYVGSISLVLDNRFDDIDAPGASVAGDGRGNTVVNWSLPLFEPIGSNQAEVTYRATVTNAVLPAATAQFLPVDGDSFPSLPSTEERYREAAKSTYELAQGSIKIDRNLTRLAKGAADLLDGVGKLADGSRNLADGLGDAADGSSELSAGLSSAREGGDKLSSGLARLAGGAGELSGGLSTARAGGEKLAVGLGELAAGGKALAAGANDLASGMSTARTGGDDLAAGLGDLGAGAKAVASGANSLSSGTSSARSGGEQLAAGLQDLDAGASKLLAGLQDLKTGLNAGLPDAQAGAVQLQAGVDKVLAGIGTAATDGTLLNGLAKVSAGQGAVADGAVSIRDGAAALAGGISTELLPGLQQVIGGLGNVPGCSVPTLLDFDGGNDTPCGVKDIVAFVAADSLATGLHTAYAQLLGGVLLSLGDTATPGATVLYGLSTMVTSLGSTVSDCATAQAQYAGGDVRVLTVLKLIECGGEAIVAGIGDAATTDTLQNGVARLTLGLDNPAAFAPGPGTNPTCATGPGLQPCGVKQALALVSGGLGQLAAGLGDAVDTLNAGLGDTTTPGETLLYGMGQLSAGADTAATGAGDLAAGLGQLDDGAKQLAGGAGQLSDGATKAADGAGQLAGGLGQLDDGAKQLAGGAGQLSDGATTAKDGAGDLAAGLGQLDEGGKQLAGGAGEAATGSRDLAAGLGKLDEGGKQLAGGLGDAADGSLQIADGLGMVKIGVGQVADGSSELQSRGTATIADGVNGGVADANRQIALLQAVDERGRAEKMPFGTVEGAIATAAYQFDIEGVAAGASGSSQAGRALLAMVLFGAVAGLGVVGNRRRGLVRG